MSLRRHPLSHTFFRAISEQFSFVIIRDGRLVVGDEIINVNGRRLRGISLQEARQILQKAPKDVDIVIARCSSVADWALISPSPVPVARPSTPSPPRHHKRSFSAYKNHNSVTSFNSDQLRLIIIHFYLLFNNNYN